MLWQGDKGRVLRQTDSKRKRMLRQRDSKRGSMRENKRERERDSN